MRIALMTGGLFADRATFAAEKPTPTFGEKSESVKSANNGKQADADNPNTLSPEEAAQGWKLLFDGYSFDGWRSFRKSSVESDRWKIDDHCLHLLPRGDASLRGGDLLTKETFGNFELAFEWKAPQGVNSGVKYLIDEYLAPGRGPVSFEYQIMVEKNLSNPLRKPIHSTGALYDMLPADGGGLRPEGVFNESRIVVRGASVEHWLNGELLLTFNRQAPEFRELVAASKFAKWAGFGLSQRGHISLQDHGGEIYLRRIRLRPLPTSSIAEPLQTASQ